MTLLDDYINRLKESRGLLHQRHLEALRNYLNTTPQDNIINEILRLQTTDDIRALWAAGLKPTEQHYALERYDQLTKVVS